MKALNEKFRSLQISSRDELLMARAAIPVPFMPFANNCCIRDLAGAVAIA